MARGKKPPNPLMQSDLDPLGFLDVVAAYAGGATLEPDCPMQEMTAVQFARLAESAVDRHRANLPPGKVGHYRERAQSLMEECLARVGYSLGALRMLEELTEIAPAKREELTASIQKDRDVLARGAAGYCAVIMREITAALERKGIKGRPPSSQNDYTAMIDAEMLHEAVNAVPLGIVATRDVVAEGIPGIVRNWFHMGHLRKLGDTEQDCIDAHSLRLRRKLDALPDKVKDWRGFSIKRRVQ